MRTHPLEFKFHRQGFVSIHGSKGPRVSYRCTVAVQARSWWVDQRSPTDVLPITPRLMPSRTRISGRIARVEPWQMVHSACRFPTLVCLYLKEGIGLRISSHPRRRTFFHFTTHRASRSRRLLLEVCSSLLFPYRDDIRFFILLDELLRFFVEDFQSLTFFEICMLLFGVSCGLCKHFLLI